ncbi:MAG: hypothetical protein JKY52_12940 [Flavobacteriales bacterium]|nr:hypothetical protein [Flavobacteriales bacterium]
MRIILTIACIITLGCSSSVDLEDVLVEQIALNYLATKIVSKDAYFLKSKLSVDNLVATNEEEKIYVYPCETYNGESYNLKTSNKGPFEVKYGQLTKNNLQLDLPPSFDEMEISQDYSNINIQIFEKVLIGSNKYLVTIICTKLSASNKEYRMTFYFFSNHKEVLNWCRQPFIAIGYE